MQTINVQTIVDCPRNLHDILVAKSIIKTAYSQGKISRPSYLRGDMFLTRAYNLQDLALETVVLRETHNPAPSLWSRVAPVDLVLLVPVIVGIIYTILTR